MIGHLVLSSDGLEVQSSVKVGDMVQVRAAVSKDTLEGRLGLGHPFKSQDQIEGYGIVVFSLKRLAATRHNRVVVLWDDGALEDAFISDLLVVNESR